MIKHHSNIEQTLDWIKVAEYGWNWSEHKGVMHETEAVEIWNFDNKMRNDLILCKSDSPESYRLSCRESIGMKVVFENTLH